MNEGVNDYDWIDHITPEEAVALGLDGPYEIIPDDSPLIKELEAHARELRPGLYAKLDAEAAKKPKRKNGQRKS